MFNAVGTADGNCSLEILGGAQRIQIEPLSGN